MRAASLLSAINGLALVLLHSTASAQELTPAEQENLELYWAYGRSPPVYPTVPASGLGDWDDAFAQATALVAQMTNAEKEGLTYGYVSTANGCSGMSGNVSRLGFPGLCLNDAGNGVRGPDMVNGYPAGVSVGAAWNRELAYQRGRYMGAEFKAKGANVALGPVVGPLGRIALGGRNWEGFSNDPYLTGSLASETVRGLQESVIACVKHFIGYEQETNRLPTGSNASVSANIDDQTIHEVYLWPFQDAVRAGAGAVMCSYNGVNGSYACQNSKTLNGLLKEELGFQGFVVSDWGAQLTGIASANAGLDLAMPSSVYWQGNLTTAVANGTMAQERLDDMATRIIAAWYKLSPLANPGFGFPYNLTLPHPKVDARDPASKSTIFQGAVEGQVLVKNTNHALPLSAPALLAIFGYDAYTPLQHDPPATGIGRWNFGYDSVLAPPDAELDLYLFYSNNSGTQTTARNDTLVTGGGSGASVPAYISSPFDALAAQAYADNTVLTWDFTSQDPIVDGAADACLVFLNEFASEGYDRRGLADAWSDGLVLNVAGKCANTIVVVHNAGIRLVDAWIEHPNVTGVVYAHLPGQDSGRALVEVLYGAQSPSGRLPYTVARQAADYGSLLSPVQPDAESDFYTQANFTEGVDIDYKAFLARNVTPRFEFGFGLTYTTFNYSSLAIEVLSNATLCAQPPGNGTAAEGGAASLWDVLVTVSADVTNVGNVTAAEVAQLYLGIPGGPERVLRGYVKESVQPGETVTVRFDLTRRDLSTWDVVAQAWVLQEGSYLVYVGASVLDVRLVEELDVVYNA